MKKVLPVFFFYWSFLFIPAAVYGQETLNCEVKSLGDLVTGMLMEGDAFGNVYVANSSGLLLSKYNAAGDLLWSKPSLNNVLRVQAMSVDANGHLFTTGYFSGSVTFGSTTLTAAGDDMNIYVVEYDADGNVLLAVATGASSYIMASGIGTDAGGNIFLTGDYAGATAIFGSSTLNRTAEQFDVFIAKLNSSGTVLWARTSVCPDYAVASGLVVDSEGHVTIAGTYATSIKFGTQAALTNGNTDTTPKDLFMVKYDSAGDPVWSYSIPRSGMGEDNAYGIACGPDDATYLTGYSNHKNLFVRKSDKNGTMLWNQTTSTIDGSASGNDIAVDSDGNSYVSGGFISNELTVGDSTVTLTEAAVAGQALVVRLDNNGNFTGLVAGVVPDNGGTAGAICISGGENIYFGGWVNGQSLTLGSTTLTGPLNYIAMMNRNNTVTALPVFLQRLTNVFPNPTQGAVQIGGLEDATWKLKVNTLSGFCIYQSEISGSRISVDLSGQAKGMYVLELYKDDAYCGTAKIIVE